MQHGNDQRISRTARRSLVSVSSERLTRQQYLSKSGTQSTCNGPYFLSVHFLYERFTIRYMPPLTPPLRPPRLVHQTAVLCKVMHTCLSSVPVYRGYNATWMPCIRCGVPFGLKARSCRLSAVGERFGEGETVSADHSQQPVMKLARAEEVGVDRRTWAVRVNSLEVSLQRPLSDTAGAPGGPPPKVC